MRGLCTSVVALSFLLAGPALADEVDMSTISCKQFTDYDKDNTVLIVTWLEAYYLGENDPPILDFTKMADDNKKLQAFCTANPTVGLITATDKLMGKTKSK
jgi:acid stress chaperone HdeB